MSSTALQSWLQSRLSWPTSATCPRIIGDVSPYYRMLETTRAYALESLIESSEVDAVARRHADYYRQLCERVEAESETGSSADAAAAYRRHLDNLRAEPAR